MTGIINLEKPAGITSAGAVNRVKRLLPRGVRIGHAGTLDPFATGVLLLLVGGATKACETLMGQSKSYQCTVKLGATTETDDPESPEVALKQVSPPSLTDLNAALQSFVGLIQQRPPKFSALKIHGRRACDLVRQGRAVELQPRAVRIDRIDVIRYSWPELELKIECGRGTYIRSLARDLGEALDTGGYLLSLRRLRIGGFDISGAVGLQRLTEEGIEAHLQPLSTIGAH